MEQEKLAYKVNPLLDIKTIRDEYKINVSTIKSILANEKMPVVWLGNKRYLRQSDLEQYIDDNTKTILEVSIPRDEAEPRSMAPSKPKAQVNKLNTMMAEPKNTSNKTNAILETLQNAVNNSKP